VNGHIYLYLTSSRIAFDSFHEKVNLIGMDLEKGNQIIAGVSNKIDYNITLPVRADSIPPPGLGVNLNTGLLYYSAIGPEGIVYTIDTFTYSVVNSTITGSRNNGVISVNPQTNLIYVAKQDGIDICNKWNIKYPNKKYSTIYIYI